LAGIDWRKRAVGPCAQLRHYVPGKPVEQLLREKGIAEAIKLASNENPYGPPPKAVAAIRRRAGDVHRYPDGNATELKEELARRHGVDTGNILLGNGSNEVLELVIRTYAGPGDEVIYSRRGFIVYALATTAAGARGVAVPERDGLSHDLEAMAAAVTERTKLVCIANPNNPTGTLLQRDAIRRFLDRLPRNIVVLLDEAYHEYVHAGDTNDPPLPHPGLVRCRTFSKAYGLAGLRIGYGVGDADLLEAANRFREPFNVNILAQYAALAALEDREWVLEKVAECLREREKLESFLARKGLLGARPHGNFVLLRHKDSRRLLHMLEMHGMIPRPLDPYGMEGWLRITVGTPRENERLMAAVNEIVKRQEDDA